MRYLLFFVVFFLASCEWQIGGPAPTPSATAVTIPAPSNTPSAMPSPNGSPEMPSTYHSKRLKPMWEASIRAGLPPMAWGMSKVCPKWWSGINQSDVWVKLWEGIIQAESGFDPTNRFVETGLGVDSVTGGKVVSEGLLQLSYQDVPNYSPGPCDQISWAKDKLLSPRDSTKTILDPIINIQCAIFIAARNLKNHPDGGRFIIGLGYYWSTARLASSKGLVNFRNLAPECL